MITLKLMDIDLMRQSQNQNCALFFIYILPAPISFTAYCTFALLDMRAFSQGSEVTKLIK